MKTFSRSLLLCLSASLLLLAGACHPTARHSTATLLDDVESYINDHPDSALAVLRGLDSTAVRGRTLRARYSLLHTMALDKCYEDITVPGLLDDATAWFSRHGSPDDRMKTYYYQGRIQQDKGNLNEAAIAYSQAEGFAEKASDAHAKGLLYLAFGSVYNAVYNYQQELQQKQKGLSILQEANDPLYDAACGELALVYHSLQEWNAADSLYRKAIENAKNSHAKALFLSNYARMKLLRPEKDPAGAIELLDLKRTETSSPLTLQEAGVYAYALVLLGKNGAAEDLIKQFESVSGPQKSIISPWLYRIADYRQEYEKALVLSREIWAEEFKVVQNAFAEEVSSALQVYYDNQASQERIKRERVGRTAIISALLLTIVILLLLIRKRKIEAERDRLFEIRSALLAEMNALEQKVSNISSELNLTSTNLKGEIEKNVSQSKLLDNQSEKLNSLTQKLELVQKNYDRDRLMRFRQLGRLGSTIWQRERNRIGETAAWQELKKNLTYIHQMQNGGVELIRRMDKELDGTISRMRHDLGLRGRPREVLFLCCCILDIDPVVISDVMGLSIDNVYKKRSRYRKRLEELGNQDYLQLMQR